MGSISQILRGKYKVEMPRRSEPEENKMFPFSSFILRSSTCPSDCSTLLILSKIKHPPKIISIFPFPSQRNTKSDETKLVHSCLGLRLNYYHVSLVSRDFLQRT